MAKMLPMLDPFDEIRRLYFSTTRETIDRDLQRALELLKRMPSDEDRDRAAGLIHGLTDLQREWRGRRPRRASSQSDGPGGRALGGPVRPEAPGKRPRRPPKDTKQR